MSSIADPLITYTSVLEMRGRTILKIAELLDLRRAQVGTRTGTRALPSREQSILAGRWFLDNTRIRQLARDNAISKSTAYDYLHEVIDVLAELAPSLRDVLETVKDKGLTHLNLDGTLIHIDRVAAPGRNGADLWWSGKHKDHGGNIQVLSDPTGFPLWTSGVRPGREHDSTCAKLADGLLPPSKSSNGSGTYRP